MPTSTITVKEEGKIVATLHFLDGHLHLIGGGQWSPTETPSNQGKRWLDNPKDVIALLQKYIDAPDAEGPSRYLLFGVLQELVEIAVCSRQHK